MDAKQLEKFSGVGMLAVLGAGVYFRLRFFFSDRAIWHDEATMALNSISGGFERLFPPDSMQIAAPGFLLVEKILARTLGPSAEALRLFPLFGGLASLLLFAWICRRHLAPVLGVLAVVLFALSPELILYSAELKSYSTDVFLAVLALWVGLDIRDRLGTRELYALVSLAIVSAWFSFSVSIVFVAVGCVVFLRTWVERREPGLLPWILCGVAFVFNGYLLYVLAVEPRASGKLPMFWSSFHLRTGLDWSSLHYNGSLFANTIQHQFGILGFPKTLVTLCVVGAAGLIYGSLKRDKYVLVSSIVIALAIVLSALGLNPIHYRVLLFMLPFFIIAFIAGVSMLLENAERLLPGRQVGVVFSCFLTLWIGYIMAVRVEHEYLVDPTPIAQYGEDFRPFFRHLEKHAQRGDKFHVGYSARQVFRYNSHNFNLGLTGLVVPKHSNLTPEIARRYVSQAAASGRSWWVFSGRSARTYTEWGLYTDALQNTGRVLSMHRSNNGVMVELADRQESRLATPPRL